MRVIMTNDMAVIYSEIKKEEYDDAIKYGEESGYAKKDQEGNFERFLIVNTGATQLTPGRNIVFNAVDEETGKLKTIIPREEESVEEFNEFVENYVSLIFDDLTWFEQVYSEINNRIAAKKATVNSLITRL